MGRAAGSALLLSPSEAQTLLLLRKPCQPPLLTKLLFFPMLRSNSPSFSHHMSLDEQHLVTELVGDTAGVQRCCKAQIDHRTLICVCTGTDSPHVKCFHKCFLQPRHLHLQLGKDLS